MSIQLIDELKIGDVAIIIIIIQRQSDSLASLCELNRMILFSIWKVKRKKR